MPHSQVTKAILIGVKGVLALVVIVKMLYALNISEDGLVSVEIARLTDWTMSNFIFLLFAWLLDEIQNPDTSFFGNIED